MKKYILILVSSLTSLSLISQDSLKVDNDTLKNFQYRVSFNHVCNHQYLMESMTDYLKTKIEYNKDLNQFIFVSNKDLEQSEISLNLIQEITFFRKIVIKIN